MAKQFDRIEDNHRSFILAQHMFFAGTAAPGGKVNISPKGMDSLRVLGPNRILWLNLTGSGNETAGHLRLLNRMTLMWCSFGPRPLILRAYGTARTLHRFDAGWQQALAHFTDLPAPRQVYDMKVEMVQSSCGYGVPLMDFTAERDVFKTWADDHGGENLPAYWEEKNLTTIDGAPTGVLGAEA